MATITKISIKTEGIDLRSKTSVVWAVDELRSAAAGRRISVSENDDVDLKVVVSNSAAAAADAGIDLPSGPEAVALFRSGDTLVAWGSDDRGLIYAITELADRVRHGGAEALLVDLPLVETPSMRVRAVSRMFCSEQEDKPWFYDRQMWREYLTMLAGNRFNRFCLTLGLQYNYPYHNNLITDVYMYCPYPFLLDLPGYPVQVRDFSTGEREANLDMLRFIGQECAKRGLDFQLALWTQRYDFDDTPNANYTIDGFTDENVAPYCRDAIAKLLAEVPEITGLTFRMHVEGGVPEGDYDFWRVAFEGIKSAGRPVEIDMHGKGLDHKMIEIARETGMPVATSPKYIAEHMSLPYHASDIRSREYPPAEQLNDREQLSKGSRKFLRYSYGDLLSKGRDWKVIYRMWPGTQRVLLWGDPVMAAGFGRSGAFADSDGIELCEPLSFKGRMGTGIPGGRALYKLPALATRYDWLKYAYQYRVWGRLTYNPDTKAEVWRRHLDANCGDAAGHCEAALSAASRILPLITQAHGPSVSNNWYWPEIYTNLSAVGPGPRRPYGFDMDTPTRFGNAPTFDPQLFANPREYAEALLADKPLQRYSPLDVADWLENLAEATELEVVKARRSASFGRPEVQRMLIDSQIAAGLGRFFAEKLRSACWEELFILTNRVSMRKTALAHLRRARLSWAGIVQVSSDIYQDDLTFGPHAYMRGAWKDRLSAIDIEITEMETTEEVNIDRVSPQVIERAGTILANRVATRSGVASLEGNSEVTAGDPLDIRVDLSKVGPNAKAVLHYRHINQAERWTSTPIVDGVGRIPGDYTDGTFPLQYYVTISEEWNLTILPGLANDLSNEPYATVMLA